MEKVYKVLTPYFSERQQQAQCNINEYVVVSKSYTITTSGIQSTFFKLDGEKNLVNSIYCYDKLPDALVEARRRINAFITAYNNSPDGTKLSDFKIESEGSNER